MSAPILPRDALCRWLGDRWETMAELAAALERELTPMQLERQLGREPAVSVKAMDTAAVRRVRRMLEEADRKREEAA